jgi:hypothetical protein
MTFPLDVVTIGLRHARSMRQPLDIALDEHRADLIHVMTQVWNGLLEMDAANDGRTAERRTA